MDKPSSIAFMKLKSEHKDSRRMFQSLKGLPMTPAIKKPKPVRPDGVVVVDEPKHLLVNKKVFRNGLPKDSCCFGSLKISTFYKGE